MYLAGFQKEQTIFTRAKLNSKHEINIITFLASHAALINSFPIDNGFFFRRSPDIFTQNRVDVKIPNIHYDAFKLRGRQIHKGARLSHCEFGPKNLERPGFI